MNPRNTMSVLQRPNDILRIRMTNTGEMMRASIQTALVFAYRQTHAFIRIRDMIQILKSMTMSMSMSMRHRQQIVSRDEDPFFLFIPFKDTLPY